MSNKNDNLVIFEDTAFTKRIYDWSRSLPSDWADVIEGCLSKYKEEQKLDKLVERVLQESHRYDNAINTWMKSSLNLAKHRQETDSLIHQLTSVQVPDSSEKTSVVIGLIKMLAIELTRIIDDHEAYWLGSELCSKIEGYENMVAYQNSDDYSLVLQKMDVGIKTLREMFHEELDYIAKSSVIDSIFQGIQETGNEILSNIKMEFAELAPITGDILDSALEKSEEMIDKFVYESQSRIDEQITAAFETLKRIFDDKLVPEIKTEIQLISVQRFLSYNDPEILQAIESHLKSLNQDIKDLDDRLEKFPDDLKQSCESFREDFKCLNALDKHKQSDEFEDKEVETLQCLFGASGTSVYARLHTNSKDLEEIAEHAYKIDQTYDWSVKSENQNLDELENIFEHAVKRLEHIQDYIDYRKGKLNG